MGYWIRNRGTSPTWSLRILLVVAVIAGLLGMHVLAGHGAPTAAGEHSSHGLLMADAATATGDATVGHPAITALAPGCADCAEHAAMASSCVLAPTAPAAVPGPPAEDLRPALAAPVVASAADDPADPRPPSISVLCISRR